MNAIVSMAAHDLRRVAASRLPMLPARVGGTAPDLLWLRQPIVRVDEPICMGWAPLIERRPLGWPKCGARAIGDEANDA